MQTQQPWAYDWNAAPPFDAWPTRAAHQGAARRARAARLLAHTLTRWPFSRSILAYILEQLEGSTACARAACSAASGSTAANCSSASSTTTRCSSRPTTATAPSTSRATCRDSCRFPTGPKPCMAYYQVPADVIEDVEELVRWARKSVAVALAHAARRKRGPRAGSPGAAQGRQEKETRAPREAAQGHALAAPATTSRCGRDPAAIRSAPSTSSRGTHRRGVASPAFLSAMRRIEPLEIRRNRERQRCGAYSLSSSRCQAPSAARSRARSRSPAASRYSASASSRLMWPCGKRLIASQAARSVRSAAVEPARLA